MGCYSYKIYRLFLTPHSCSVTLFTLGFRLFFIHLANKPTSFQKVASTRWRQVSAWVRRRSSIACPSLPIPTPHSPSLIQLPAPLFRVCVQSFAAPETCNMHTCHACTHSISGQDILALCISRSDVQMV